ncbi:PAS domain-containing protein [Stieleria sp. JC731]|uniref:chemotaxis protein CheB n=1 Tax=Pirellulaceae TaxID=2691357 RepID=UPI001E5CA735|nr:chemotaxis protein CheB [Stieleria sp. JC731]MCC9600341.1 PAS domain-containing protein [Stieleria sp. JC731]
MSDKNESPNLVVGIGASAGGLAPIQEFFDHMPADTGMAFVVVQHLSPDFKSLMDELLARHTKMAIHKVVDRIEVDPNSIYLIPPEKNMALSEGKLLLTDQDQDRGLNLPIDIFFRSLATDAGDRAVAVVMSGTGSDGSRGVSDVRHAGGIVIAQSPESAGFDGMPQATIRSGAVDAICAPPEMAERIVQYCKNRNREQLATINEHAPPTSDSGIFSILRMYRLHNGVDFALYKPATITRRIERRMQMGGFIDIGGYASFLEDNQHEFDLLFRDLLVEVTQFFRDPSAFEKLRQEFIPKLVANAPPSEDMRAWVPGCATGEEAYSLALLFAEAIEKSGRHDIDFKVFATDVHRTSLETASMAVYPVHALDQVPPELALKYFTRNNGLCHIKREIRQRVIFAANDITSDPPFTRIDLISCRNVLIYLEARVQHRVLSMFHFGLRIGGVLFLGPSETVGDLAPEFETLDRHWRIYSKKRDVRLPDAMRITSTPALQSVIPDKNPMFVASAPKSDRQAWLTSAYEELLAKYVPPSFLINDFGELVHTFGDARKLLVQPEGRPTLDAIKLLSGELRTAVSAGVLRAKQDDQPIVFNGIHHQIDGENEATYRVTIEPYRKATQNLYLISVEPTEQHSVAELGLKQIDASEFANERITQLERELGYTRETLQATVEELESSNEELQATNEELIASNEELQSTNEELHSVNEELYTVNAEHKQKIEELTQMTSDMDNLLKSTDIGTIFLDKEFKIRMFTPAISAAFNVLDQDIGRPIEHIAYKLDSPNLIADAEEVLESQLAKEVEVQNGDGRVFLQRMQPYRDESGKVEGIVLTTTEITAIKEAERAKQTMLTLAQINEELPDFAYAVSHDLEVPLRHIQQYAQILEKQAGDSTSEEIFKSVRVINESTSTLRNMIDALLAYSRINTRGGAMRQVELDEVVSDATHSLASTLQYHDATIDIGEMPIVSGDPDQLQTLFFHLFDNAIKYRSKDAPVIKVEATTEGRFAHISVIDNGIGIAPKHFDRVFSMFKRLGFEHNVPGIGAGLALCKRIIVRHGGKIWIEPNRGHGTIVKFSLYLANTDQGDEA